MKKGDKVKIKFEALSNWQKEGNEWREPLYILSEMKGKFTTEEGTEYEQVIYWLGPNKDVNIPCTFRMEHQLEWVE